MLNNIDLAVIVVNYKLEDLTISFVEKELSKIKLPHITVIINNEATDQSNSKLCKALKAKLLESNSFDVDNTNGIFVLPSPENLGFAKGNNLGVYFTKKYFNPAFFLFTNNDIKISDNNVVDKLISKLESVSSAGVIGPRVIGLDGKNQSPYPYRSFWDKHIWIYWSTFFYSREKKIKKFRIDYPDFAKEGYHYYVMGSFFVVRAKDFYDCGMFDPHTFLYAEELILSERMKGLGKKVYYYPEVSVIHAHGVTTSKFSKGKSNDWLFESECYYYKNYIHTSSLLILIGRFTYHLMKVTKGLFHKRL